MDIELRDEAANLGDHTPETGAKFLATNTGVVYTGDGTDWITQFVLPGYDDSAGEAQFDQSIIAPTVDTGELTGSLTGGQALTDVAGTNLSIDSNGTLNASGGSGGGIQGLSGGDGITPGSIGDDDELSIAPGDFAGTHLSTDGSSNLTVDAGSGLENDGSDNLAVASGGIGTSELATPFTDLATLVGTPISLGGDLQSSGALQVNTNRANGGDRAPELGVPGSDGNGNTAGGNVLAGSPNNSIDGGAVGAVVGGGGSDSDPNAVSADYGTVGGGRANTASGQRATVPGGFVGEAESDDSFVWNDGTAYHDVPTFSFSGLSSDTAVNGEPVTESNTFSVSATGGVRFITGSAENPNVTYIPSDSAG